MPNLTCTVCNAEVFVAGDRAKRILCSRCSAASMFDILPVWPTAGQGMLPGAHQMMSGDDDEDGGGEDEADKDEDKGKFSAKPGAGKKGKGDDDDDQGKYADKPGKGKKSKAPDDDDDDDDDRPRKKRRGDDSDEAAAKGGMGMGMILGIVGVLLACCLCVSGGGVGVMFLGKDIIPAAGRQQSINNAKQIALAEHGFHDANKFFPGPRSEKADLSWRVAILPYIEQNALLNQFDQNAGWDNGRNQALLASRPMVYDCPMRSPADKTQTPWQYFTGPNTMFPTPTTRLKITDIADGTSNTFLFAEGANSVPWSKPADIVVPAAGPVSVPQGNFIAALCDGSVRLIDRKRVDDNSMRLLINPRDNQPLPPGLLD